MTPSALHRLLIAPEIIVVDLALAALRALDRALLAEHPRLHAPPDPSRLPSSNGALASSSDSPPDLRRALRDATATSPSTKSSPTPTSPDHPFLTLDPRRSRSTLPQGSRRRSPCRPNPCIAAARRATRAPVS